MKPANVLLTPDDHAYVSDFGLTKRAVSVSGLTETGQLIGTIDYVAPEQIKGDPVDQRADVYSLGCLLFECLTGHAPYPRDIEVGVLWAHVETPPPSLTEERPDLPPEVDDVLALAMAKDPAERTAAAGDVAAGFRSALGLEPGRLAPLARAQAEAEGQAPENADRGGDRWRGPSGRCGGLPPHSGGRSRRGCACPGLGRHDRLEHERVRSGDTGR